MLHIGNQITGVADMLQPISLDELFQRIINPSTQLQQHIQQLRIVRTMDAKRYATLKRDLPYFVCATFNPAIRKTENFAHISHFVVDIDHVSDKGLDIEQLRKTLYADSRVVMGFLSPSQDGIKLIFQLTERCYDAGQFSLFYKDFAKQFANQYQLEQVLDVRTCDVTRACFLSYDPQAHHNPFAEEVNLKTFIESKSPLELFDLKRQQEREAHQTLPTPPTEETTSEPDESAINKIKEVLGIYRAKKEQNKVYVPERLNAIIEELKSFLSSLGLHVSDISDISYGKKIHATMGMKQAECNLFFGKRGFSVVKTPRKGTDAELNDMLQELILAFLAS